MKALVTKPEDLSSMPGGRKKKQLPKVVLISTNALWHVCTFNVSF